VNVVGALHKKTQGLLCKAISFRILWLTLLGCNDNANYTTCLHDCYPTYFEPKTDILRRAIYEGARLIHPLVS